MSCCNHPPQSQPTMLGMAATATTAFFRFALGGFRQVSDADREARQAVCDGCDRQVPKGTCAVCGCDLNIKTRMPAEYCPKNKWPPLS